MITPYLSPIATEGGTLYVFPSVSNDLTKTFVSSDYEFKFSHFACLNIPNIYKGKYSDGKEKGLYIETLFDSSNYYQYDNRPNISNSSWTNDAMQRAITENIQNYVMNFETAILNGEGDNDDYDSDILTTVSEKVFWNWMQKVGAIKFNDSGTAEIYENLEERTVQYIGNIDVMNTVEINGDVFEELYIHIPSTVGASTSVIFRTGEMTDTKNYLNKRYSLGQNTGEYIIGRTDGDENPNHGRDLDNPVNISIKSITDYDYGANIYVGDMGHTIDFRDSSYDGGDGINNMNSKSLEDFQFNAVLIYYDIYEKTSTPNVKRVATNLYGILFLDNVTDLMGGVVDDNGAQGYIQRYPKKRETVYGNGNSYALKLDLKVDTFGDTSSTLYIEDTDDHLTSMNLYMKALEQLQQCIDMFYTQRAEIVKLSKRIDTLENLIMGIDTVSAIKEDIVKLYDLCDSNSMVDTSTILGLIDKNTKRLDTIMSGGKDLKIQFDTDVLQPGVGIGLQKSQNKVVINSEQKYSINTIYNSNDEEITSISSTDESKVCKIPLMPGENFAVININDTGKSQTDLIINIDEEINNYQWEIGQSLKIIFVCEVGSFEFDDDYKSTNGIIIKPTNGITLPILAAEFEGNNLIEVVCIDENKVNGEKKFIYLIK